MRTKAFLISNLVILLTALLQPNHASGQSPAGVIVPSVSAPRPIVQSVSTGSTYVCPKCGRVHTRNSTPSASQVVTSYRPPVSSAPVATTSYVPNASPVPVTSSSAGGTQNVLSMLNAQRSRQGLRTLRYDPVLQSVAERRVQLMASTGRKGHPPGSFAPGRYEGVGWSSSYSPRGVSACYTSNPNMTAAGAAMARGRDGVYFAVVYR